jgi:hypothetical protein
VKTFCANYKAEETFHKYVREGNAYNPGRHAMLFKKDNDSSRSTDDGVEENLVGVVAIWQLALQYATFISGKRPNLKAFAEITLLKYDSRLKRSITAGNVMIDFMKDCQFGALGRFGVLRPTELRTITQPNIRAIDTQAINLEDETVSCWIKSFTELYRDHEVKAFNQRVDIMNLRIPVFIPFAVESPEVALTAISETSHGASPWMDSPLCVSVTPSPNLMPQDGPQLDTAQPDSRSSGPMRAPIPFSQGDRARVQTLCASPMTCLSPARTPLLEQGSTPPGDFTYFPVSPFPVVFWTGSKFEDEDPFQLEQPFEAGP